MNFIRPKYLTEAFEVLDLSSDAAVLCGGLTHLLRFYKEFPYGPHDAPESVIYLGDLASLSDVEEEHERLDLGATLKIKALAEDTLVRRHLPALWEAALLTSTPQIRNQRTLGGEIVWGSFHSPIIATLMALDAELKIRKPAVENIPAHEEHMDLFDFYDGEIERKNSHGQTLASRKSKLGTRDLLLKISVPAARFRKPGSFCFVKALQPKISTENPGIVVAVSGHASNGVLTSAQYVVAGAWLKDFKDDLPFEGVRLHPNTLFEKLYYYFERQALEKFRRAEGPSERQLSSMVFGLVKEGFSGYLGLG